MLRPQAVRNPLRMRLHSQKYHPQSPFLWRLTSAQTKRIRMRASRTTKGFMLNQSRMTIPTYKETNECYSLKIFTNSTPLAI